MRLTKENKGISLIVLVITIVVMIILATAVILSLTSNGIIEKSNIAKAKNNLSNLQEAVSLKTNERMMNNLNINKRYKLSEWGINNADYEDRVLIEKGKILVKRIEKADAIEKAAEELGMLTKLGNTSLENTTGSNLINYRIYGNSVQDGTPTPQERVEIDSVGELVTDVNDVKYKISIVTSGKNMFDKTDVSLYGPNISEVTYEDYVYIARGNEGNNAMQHSAGALTLTLNTTLKANKTYTFTIPITLLEQGKYSEKTNIMIGNNEEYSKYSFYFSLKTNEEIKTQATITPSVDIDRITIRFNNNKLKIDLNGIMIEEGPTSTEYEPYIEPITTNIYLDEPLRKIGDEADYIDFKEQKIVRKVGAAKLDNSLTWADYTSQVDGYYKAYTTGMKLGNDNGFESAGFAKSSHFSVSDVYGSKESIGFTKNATYISISSSKASSVSSFKEWLTNNNIDIIYKLRKPTETSVTLPNISTFRGTTTISVLSNNGVGASNIEVEY